MLARIKTAYLEANENPDELYEVRDVTEKTCHIAKVSEQDNPLRAWNTVGVHVLEFLEETKIKGFND